MKVVAANLVSNSLGHRQSGRAARLVGARAGSDHGRRRRAGGAAPADRRAGARLRLPRVLVAQAVRADERRRALGAAGAARADGAVQPRRPHDPRGSRRGDDLGRGAGEVRGGHAADRRGGGVRGGRRLHHARPGSSRSSSTSTTSRRTRSSGSPTSRGSSSTARRPSGAPASSRSTSATCIPTTWRRCSTWRASRSARVTTAASR